MQTNWLQNGYSIIDARLGPPPFSSMNSTRRTRRSANSLQPRHASPRERFVGLGPLGPRLWDEELTLPV